MEKAKTIHNRRPTTFQDLPDDTLSLIFSHINDTSDLKSITRVCKFLYTFISSQVYKLTLRDSLLSNQLSSLEFLKLFKRFSCIEELHIECYRSVHDALLALSLSNLEHLEKLHVWVKIGQPMFIDYPALSTVMATSKVIMNIKSLNPICVKGSLSNRKRIEIKNSISSVIQFINMFPSLVELDLSRSYEWSDYAIHKVMSKLPYLQKLNLGTNLKLTDKTLDILSSNCPKLESVNFQECTFTGKAMYKYFCENPQFRSVYLPSYRSDPSPKISELVEFTNVLKYVNDISLVDRMVHDAVLTSLAESCPPLKSLKIGPSCFSTDYTMVGLSKLLSASSGIETLIVHLPKFPVDDNCQINYDKEMGKIVTGLPSLRYVKVVSQVLSQSTLFSLVKNCQLLESICLKKSSTSKLLSQLALTGCTTKNYNIRSIEIRFNMSPANSALLRKAVASCCPNSKMQIFKW